MYLKSTAAVILWIVLLLSGCGQTNSNLNNKALKEEMANREIKKVSEGEIIDAAFKRGRFIADTTQYTILSALQQHLNQSDSIKSAFIFCKAAAYPLTDSLSKSLSTIIRRVSLKTRNKENEPTTLESTILDSYGYNLEKNLPLEDNVQRMDDQYLLYTKPIVIGSPVCLRCHGKVGEDLSQEDYALIKELYPEDEATGYQLGNFRGMFSIKISQKELIKDL